MGSPDARRSDSFSPRTVGAMLDLDKDSRGTK